MRLALIAALLLAGCVTTPDVGLRPGLTAAQVAAPLPKPVGRTYRWQMSMPEGGIDTALLTLRAVASEQGQTRYLGAISIPLPPELTDLARADDIAREISLSLIGSDAGIRFGDGVLRIPAELVLDGQGRARTSTILNGRQTYSPHDCFATLGTCSYTTTSDDGQSGQVRVTTTERNGTWTSDIRGPGRDRSRQIYTLDQDGVMLDMVTVAFENGRREVFKLERQ